MKADWREHVFRFLLSICLSLGLILTCLNALDLPSEILTVLGVVFLFSASLELSSLNRKTILAGAGFLLAAGLLWLFAGGGSGTLLNLLRAVSLRFSGISFALPLVASDFSLALSVGVTLLGFLCARKSAGGIPAMMLCGLGLMTAWRMDRFPLVWYLAPTILAAVTMLVTDLHEEISPIRVFPWLAAMVVLAVLLTPSSGLISPVLQEQAARLRQGIMDRLFYTEPRDVFSLQSEGFYPEGSGQLGGKVTPSENPVMQVSSPRTVYLRGVMLNEYDGRAWRNTLGGRRYLWDSPSSLQNRLRLFNQDLPADALAASLTEPLPVSVRMLSDSASTLFVPQRIRELRVGGELVPYFSNSSEVFITRNLQPGDTWSASAPLFTAGDPGLGILVDAAAFTEDPFWESVTETFTALPSHLEEPVWQMAMDVTAAHTSPYEKAFALQSFLSRSYRYTLDVEPQPPDLDFVTNFLFNTGEGYCTYFASAMTVLCRMAGLPARYVEGYCAHPNAVGEALVTGLNAHAWTEVYFKGFGWITFDATPRSDSFGEEGTGGPDSSDSSESEPTPPPEGGSAPSPTPEPAPAGEEEAESPDADPSASPEAGQEDHSGGFSLRWLLLLIPLLLLMLLRWLWTSPSLREKRASGPEAVFDIWLAETTARLSARKLRRGPGETPMSFTRRLDGSEDLPVPLSPLGECVSLLRYAKAAPQDTDLALVRDTAVGLRNDQSLSVRLRYVRIRMWTGMK